MKWLRRHIGWIAGVAVGGMILWLAFSATTLQRVQESAAGILFGRPVQAQEYRKALEAVTHAAVLRFGDRFRDQVRPSEMEQQAWERLILLTEARRLGIRVSDQEVVEEVQKIPLFQTKEGQFDRAGYETIVRYSLGATSRAYEEEIREDLAIQKLFDRVVGTPTLSEQEILEGFRRRETQIQVNYLLLPQYGLAQEIADAARSDPSQMEKTARQISRKVKTTGFFKSSEPAPELGLGRQAGSLFDLKSGEISRPLPVTPADGSKPAAPSWLIVQLKETKPADESKLAEARPQLEKTLLDQKRLRAYLTWYQDLIKRANPQPHGPSKGA
ncbi:MAG: SurA N-terminal domain-containing protein [Candidatus Omnitrophica bacterium]|nr:SurA N-terminal domain-containing protein [Candidatus Omnitrophota bacterium]